MAFVYGPVPSQRLGQSLGVDPIPFKTCNYNCVYCQLGRTTPLTNQRRDFFPPEAILTEVRAALAAARSRNVDYVTIVGQGEPLLCASLGRIIAGIKASTALPVAVITNGSLLFRADVREALLSADLVMPSLDAADAETFRRLDRPWSSLDISRIVDGLVAFRDAFAGRLWVEVMLVRGLNDGQQALLATAAALARIRPDRVHLNVPTRPPAEQWAEPPDDAGLRRAIAILGQSAAVVAPAEGGIVLPSDVPLAEAIVQVVRRHPATEADLREALSHGSRSSSSELKEALSSLERCGEARRRVYRGQTFWEYAGTRWGTRHCRTNR